ncbi:MAG: GGDEF domain-containing protein, partial [Clostridia bacterium]|nr:GGDEF domain-containing protein [Clostridia bacterium]
METVNVLYSEVNLISLFVMFVVLIKSLGFTRMESRNNFIYALIAQIVFTLSDTVFVLFHRGMLPHIGPLLILFKSIYFLSTIVLALMWYLYFETVQGSKVMHDKSGLLIASIPVWIMVYILIANLFNHALFYVNESGQYTRGPWFHVAQYVFPFIYVYLICDSSIRCAYHNRNVPEGRQYLSHAALPLIPITTSVVQCFFPGIPLTNIALALTTLVMYVNSTDDAVSVDALTQLPNRKQFMKQMNRWFITRNETIPMYFMILDVDKFKYVNDRYGHTEGDAALIRVADSLRAACAKQRKKSVIGRY